MSVTDANGNVTEYTYDPNTDELLSTTGDVTSSSTAAVNYAYNSTTKSLASITRNGFSYNFTYDVFNRVTSTKVGSQTLCSYTYNSDGTLQKETYGNGTVHSYSYDNLDRLTAEKYDGSTVYSYYYGSDGALGRTVDHTNNITTTYIYDYAGRITDVDNSNKALITYGKMSPASTS